MSSSACTALNTRAYNINNPECSCSDCGTAGLSGDGTRMTKGACTELNGRAAQWLRDNPVCSCANCATAEVAGAGTRISTSACTALNAKADAWITANPECACTGCQAAKLEGNGDRMSTTACTDLNTRAYNINNPECVCADCATAGLEGAGTRMSKAKCTALNASAAQWLVDNPICTCSECGTAELEGNGDRMSTEDCTALNTKANRKNNPVCSCPGCEHWEKSGIDGERMPAATCAGHNADAPLSHSHTIENCTTPKLAKEYGFETTPIVTGSSDINSADHNPQTVCGTRNTEFERALAADPWEKCVVTLPDGKTHRLRPNRKRSTCVTDGTAYIAEHYAECACPGCEHWKITGVDGEVITKVRCAKKNAEAPLVHTHTKEWCVVESAAAKEYGYPSASVTGSSDINASDHRANAACRAYVAKAEAAMAADPWIRCKFKNPGGRGMIRLEHMKTSDCPAAIAAWVAANLERCSCDNCDRVVRNYNGSALANINGEIGYPRRCRIANEIASDTLRWQLCAAKGGKIEDGKANIDCAQPFASCKFLNPEMNCGSPLPPSITGIPRMR